MNRIYEMLEMSIQDKQMTIQDIKDLSEVIQESISLMDCDWDDQQLIDANYKVWTVTVGETIFTAYHGFPGDNPAGCVVNSANEIITEFGECGIDLKEDLKVNTFLQWYVKETEECTNYEHKLFRPIM